MTPTKPSVFVLDSATAAAVIVAIVMVTVASTSVDVAMAIGLVTILASVPVVELMLFEAEVGSELGREAEAEAAELPQFPNPDWHPAPQ